MHARAAPTDQGQRLRHHAHRGSVRGAARGRLQRLLQGALSLEVERDAHSRVRLGARRTEAHHELASGDYTSVAAACSVWGRHAARAGRRGPPVRSRPRRLAYPACLPQKCRLSRTMSDSRTTTLLPRLTKPPALPRSYAPCVRRSQHFKRSSPTRAARLRATSLTWCARTSRAST